MQELNREYKKIIEDLEKNIPNKEQLNYVKEQIFKITSLFMEQLEKILEVNEVRFGIIEKRQEETDIKVNILEDALNDIERDIYMEEQDEFNIVCPYCNYEFTAEVDEERKEIICPECNNVIELDWNEEEYGCSGNCSNCHEDCDDDDEKGTQKK